MKRLLLFKKRELGWGLSRQRRRKMAQCGVKSSLGHAYISPQYKRTPQMESQGSGQEKYLESPSVIPLFHHSWHALYNSRRRRTRKNCFSNNLLHLALGKGLTVRSAIDARDTHVANVERRCHGSASYGSTVQTECWVSAEMPVTLTKKGMPLWRHMCDLWAATYSHTHMGFYGLWGQGSFSDRLLSLSCSTDRVRRWFLPHAIRLLNTSQGER